VTDRTPGTADLLDTIVAATRRIVEVRQSRESLPSLARKADARPKTGGRFRAAVEQRARVNIIAECKRRSPSRGVLRADYDAVALAASYARHGAAAISVLTEPTFFDGSLADLSGVCATVNVPVLRKDFVIDEYQLFEARVAGADAVLLIVAALEARALTSLMHRAAELGLDVLVEVHNPDELARGLDAGARMVGVNNRNLRTLAVDVHASETLIERIPGDIVAISESGLKTCDDLLRLGRLGYRGFLIGERFMAATDPGAELGALLRGRTSSDAKVEA
jgi:indole-3-glycerol phosphate synthase